jgi:hypothetical protein
MKFMSGVASMVVMAVLIQVASAADPVTPAAPAPAPAAAAVAPLQAQDPFRYGADLRLREEAYDHFQGAGSPVENNYFRIRPRLWGEWDLMQNVTMRIRLVDEMRYYLEPDQTSKSPYNWPDEMVGDNIYVDFKGLMDKTLDIRVGRQDLQYGTGKLVLDGTPGDGSRTLYFNAIKAVSKAIEKTQIDAFAIWNPQYDDLAVNLEGDPNLERNLTGYTKPLDDVYESGGGIYAVNKSIDWMPIDAYVIYKRESAYDQAATTNKTGAYNAPKYAWQTVNADAGTIENPAADIVAIGGRVNPQITENVKGNLEMTLQVGTRDDEDVLGYMVDAALVQNLPVLKDYAPAADYGVYYLSGDDPSTDKDEGWDPLWARYPQNSELYVYWFPGGRWSNLIMPQVYLSCKPTADVKITLGAAYLLADEKDSPTGESDRGTLGVIKEEFTLGKGLLASRDKLSGHLWLEVFEPGDYYSGEDTAYFARWQLMYEY